MEKLKSILLIDDDAICNWLNKTVLEDLQLAEEVVSIDDGNAALAYLEKKCKGGDAAKSSCPDLIFLDLNMPGTDGFEVLEKLRQIDGNTNFSSSKVVVLTSSQHELDLEKISSFPILDYLIKPLTEKKAASVVGKFLEQEKSANQNIPKAPLKQADANNRTAAVNINKEQLPNNSRKAGLEED